MKFIWNGQFYIYFGEKLARAPASWNFFLWVYLSYQIIMFFLRTNQTVIHVFFVCFAILCFALILLSKSCVFSIPPFLLFKRALIFLYWENTNHMNGDEYYKVWYSYIFPSLLLQTKPKEPKDRKRWKERSINMVVEQNGETSPA